MISLKLISGVIFNQRDVDEISCLHSGSLALLLLALCLGSTCGVWSTPTGFRSEGASVHLLPSQVGWLLFPTSLPHLTHPTFLAPCSNALVYLPIACTSLKNRSGIVRFFMSSRREPDAHLESNGDILRETNSQVPLKEAPGLRIGFGGNYLAAIR